MRDEGSWLVVKIFFYEHPEKMHRLHIKLKECTAIAISNIIILHLGRKTRIFPLPFRSPMAPMVKNKISLDPS
jgi:hypothetical protein